MASPIAFELRRFAHAAAAARGRRLASRGALGVALVFFLGVLWHRVRAPLAPIARLEARPFLTLLAVAGVLLLARILEWVARRFARPAPRALARGLDDALGLADGADAALSAARRAPGDPLGELLAARVALRLATESPQRFSGALGRRSRLPGWLAVSAWALLFAPGVLGIGATRGAGRGEAAGVGRRPEPEATASGPAATPLDADAWLAAHGRLRLEVPDPTGSWNRWIARLVTDEPLPAALRGRLHLYVDGRGPLGPVERLEAPPGLSANAPVPLQGDGHPVVKERLTPGRHEVSARLQPEGGPYRAPLDSLPIEVVVPPPEPGGGNSPPPPEPPPPSPPPPDPPPPTPPPPSPSPPEPPPPEPPPPAGPGGPPPPPPEASLHDEVVDPLDRGGPTVRKEEAVVAVRAEDAGTKSPEPVPLREALRDLDRVLERAVGAERVLPADQAYLRRYLEALRRAVTPP